jgi:YHS domain-containing protein
MNKVTALILGFVFLTAGLAFAQQTPSVAQAKVKAVEVGNKICPVSGNPVALAVKFEWNGKIYNFCCPMCIEEFKKNPEKYSKIAEDEVKAAKK